MILRCVLLVKMQMLSKRLQSERGEVDFDLCFIRSQGPGPGPGPGPGKLMDLVESKKNRGEIPHSGPCSPFSGEPYEASYGHLRF